MNVAGFTAEASLYRTTKSYRTVGAPGTLGREAQVLLQALPLPPIFPTPWPSPGLESWGEFSRDWGWGGGGLSELSNVFDAAMNALWNRGCKAAYRGCVDMCRGFRDHCRRSGEMTAEECLEDWQDCMAECRSQLNACLR
jgi:hypothetical protein